MKENSAKKKINIFGYILILFGLITLAFPFSKRIYSNIENKYKIEKIIKRINDKDFNIKVGTIASGDIFCTESKMKEKIRNKFNADCIEMEGSAIAQVCKLDKIPFLVVRSISDKPNGQNEITFDKFLEKASRRCAYIINEFFTHQ